MEMTQLQELLTFMECREEQEFQKDEPSSCGTILENIYYHLDRHPQHTLDILYPVKAKRIYPVIFYIHGGGFCMHSKDRMYRNYATRLAQDEFALVNINYRLAPTASYAQILLDVQDALCFVAQHAPEYHLDPTCIFLCGDSAGGYLAMQGVDYLLKESIGLTCRGVGSLCGILDLQECKNNPEIKFPLKKEILHMLFLDDVIPNDTAIYRLLSKEFPAVYLMDTAWRSFDHQAKVLNQYLKQYAIPHKLHILPKEEKLKHNFQIVGNHPKSKLVMQEMFTYFHSFLK